MCGFAGYIAPENTIDYQDILRQMGESIRHRGPDSGDIWQNTNVSVGLVHRRLAIQDLSPFGAQPMVSSTGRYVIAFNGEVYNFKKLRAELAPKGYVFSGHSDTEVMLAAIEEWGVKKALTRFAGMFAFALVDNETQQITLARDRMGEKPLYYGKQNNVWLFGSELSALKQHPEWSGEINRDALTLLLRHNFISAPHTIYKNIYKLAPASYTTICSASGKVLIVEPYWSVNSYFQENMNLNFEQASEQLEAKLNEVVDEQMISDAPLGAFLSGGVDSSTITALMQQQSSDKIKTFSIGFEEPEFNEAPHAKAVAEHLGTDHHELYFSAKQALDIVPNIANIYDEPFADSSQLPTFILSQMTREKVTVALSGDGGDELFCGYSRYFDYIKQWQIQQTTKHTLIKQAFHLPDSILAKALAVSKSEYKALSSTSVLEKIAKVRTKCCASSLSDFYLNSLSYWVKPQSVIIDAKEVDYQLRHDIPKECQGDLHKSLMWHDINWYLPDDILVKVDRAAMACSLETRVPMLDHRIVEFALSLPISLNVDGNTGKQLLRSVLYRHVPKKLIERPKAGFAVPIASWLRNELREWAEELLNTKRIVDEGYWNATIIESIWQEHLAGKADYSFQLWGVLMFQAWLENETR
jgi:asparagine synthase (glutamine-hydrolysing)